ncbi:MAG: SMC-Scp complex subunit ScpB [Candidatus Firestonebacteria bacterium]
MDLSFKKDIIECLLFVSGKPLSVKRINEVLEEFDEEVARKLLAELQIEYETLGRPFSIVEIAEGFQIVTKPQFAVWIKRLYKARIVTRLSKAALETLAIVSYKQPVTRLEIEGIRGVSTEGVLETLLERNLIAIKGRKECIGRPLLYGTTQEFLRYFGLKSLVDLPRVEELLNYLRGDEKTCQKNGKIEESIRD